MNTGKAKFSEAFASTFPEHRLPAAPHARFGALFARKPDWRAREIEPYVRPLVVVPEGDDAAAVEKGVATLLLKHTRVRVEDGRRIHSAR